MLHWFRSLDRVLKGEATRPTELKGGTIQLPVVGLGFVVLLLGAVYGLCMGSFSLMARWSTDFRHAGYQQMLASAAKVPMLFLLTLLVTFPSLYVFNALVGSRLNFGTVLRLMLAALAVLMAVLASFGTIVVFFSLCTTSYPFIVLLNVLTFAIAGLLGMRFLLQTLHRLSLARAIEIAEVETAAVTMTTEAQATDAPAVTPPPIPGALDRLAGQAIGSHVKTVFRIWVIVFGLVGAQMGWMLRPFIGNPNMPFTFFRERDDSNFFSGVYNTTVNVLQGNTGQKKPGWPRDRRMPSSVPTPPKPTTAPSSVQDGSSVRTE